MNPEALKQSIENQKSDEILQCIDKLCELTGTEKFSDQLNQLSSALKESQEDLMKKTGMSREEVEKASIDIPKEIGKTVTQVFTSTANELKALYSDPEKLKAAFMAAKEGKNGNN